MVASGRIVQFSNRRPRVEPDDENGSGIHRVVFLAQPAPDCPSSDDLRHIAGFQKGGSGSSVVEIKRPAVDAANDDWRWSGV